jgi:hypothetical protein
MNMHPCEYCGTSLNPDDTYLELATGHTHHVALCREYLYGAFLHCKRKATLARAVVDAASAMVPTVPPRRGQERLIDAIAEYMKVKP